MKICCIVHGYPPVKNAGAEWMLHEMMKYMADRGHFVTVRLGISDLKPYEIDGVKVDRDMYKITKEDLLASDLMISHLNRQGWAVNAAELWHKPLVLIHHNTNGFGPLKAKHKLVKHERFLYQIYNSEWAREKLNYPNPSIVVHPPVEPSRVKTRRGSKITLINTWPKKGGEIFAAIAAQMPDHAFLGVGGGYGERDQVVPTTLNVEYIENTPDIKKVYGKTRILLMPSDYESYGRTGVEAMVSGIPVIAHPTPGLKESLGDAGIFVDRNDIRGYMDAIKALDDPEAYKEASAKATARAKEIEAGRMKELADMEEFLIRASKRDL